MKKSKKKDSPYTRIIVVLDRTGSMAPIKHDVIGGFNSFLKKQREVIGTRITLVQFDSQNPHEVVYQDLPVSEAPELTEATYVPRASTPLYDAVGQTIAKSEAQEMVSSNPEIAFAKTVFVIVTDGQENSSREYTAEHVRKLIKQKKKQGWQFVFLSADLDSFETARSIGIPMANSMAYDHNRDGTQSAFASLAVNTVSYAGGQSASMAWSDEDRDEQAAEKLRDKKK